jgi:iron complex transport system permease protein
LRKSRGLIILLLALFVSVFLFSFYLGKFPISFDNFVHTLQEQLVGKLSAEHSQFATIMFKIRFPRVVMAAVIGAGIALAGAAYQALFQNPMVSQDILGASQGAAFGAALGLYLSQSYQVVVSWAFLGGLIAVGLVLFLAKIIKGETILYMILIGMMVGSLFSSAVSFLKLIGDPMSTLPAITYWLMGSLSGIKQQDVAFAVPLIVIGCLPIFFLRWRLNLMSLGTQEAESLGVNTRNIRVIMVFAATLITAAAVSVTGMIGWVGLIIPHFARLIVGNDYRKVVPVSALLGASFLLIVDDIARMLTTSEIPIGILTSFIGAPVFLLLLIRNAKMTR